MKLRAIIAVLACAVSAFAADVTGKWKANFEGQNGPIEIIYNFQTDGGKVTGSVTGPSGEMAISDGKLDGETLTFTVVGDEFKVVHTGKVSAGQIQFKVEMGERTFDLTAKKVS